MLDYAFAHFKTQTTAITLKLKTAAIPTQWQCRNVSTTACLRFAIMFDN